MDLSLPYYEIRDEPEDPLHEIPSLRSRLIASAVLVLWCSFLVLVQLKVDNTIQW